ncbi:MAG: multidrug DMT transporter permease, partial [Merdibacter sp.]
MLWVAFAFGSAFFAGITAILAKIGIRDVDSTLATALRTVVILLFSWLMVFVVGSQGELRSISSETIA